MENTKDISRIVEPLMEKMKNFAAVVPQDDFMTYLYKAHDIVSYYEDFLKAETEEELEQIQKNILAKIASYYG